VKFSESTRSKLSVSGKGKYSFESQVQIELQPAQHDPEFVAALRQALTRLVSELENCVFLKSPAWEWIENLGGKLGPESYFLHRSATPVFLVPWYFERSLNRRVDFQFHGAVMYSTLNLCYYVRLLDDAVDDHKGTRHLLCALSFFHSRYQGAYSPFFAPSDPFWRNFFELNDLSCDITAHDSALKDVSVLDFHDISARKSCAALVSLAAIAARYNRRDAFAQWTDFWYAFGRWNQMRDDLIDWQKDLQSGMPTYLLSEAHRRKNADEPVPQWMIREGFDWAGATLEGFGSEARDSAGRLGSPELQNYVDMRVNEVTAKVNRLRSVLAI
jgi:hypothetical protein